jgi:acetyltransferase-like isoleucine patch superfamily enzyme
MFYTNEELKKIGFKSIGNNVLISNKTSIYGAKNIEIGSNVRIDDFCVISAGKEGIKIGNNIHIAVFCSIIGEALIIMDDFSGLSSRVSIYSSSDDYSGESLTNPTLPREFTNVQSGTVHLKKHVIVGAGSIILPNVILDEGVAVGALSLVTKSFESYKIIAGSPAKIIKPRKNNLLNLELKWNLVNQLK